MSGHLPPEILVEIFLKLPLKTLVRCTCTCKLWSSIITSPSFISLHLNHSLLSSRNKRNPLLVRRRPDHEFLFKMGTFSIYHFNDNQSALVEEAEIQFNFAAETFVPLISSSVNGVTFLFRDEEYILFNASIKKYLVLPCPPLSNHPHVIGFGYAGKTDDYKVVRIVYLEPHAYVLRARDPHVVQVYSLNSRAWHDVNSVHPSCSLLGWSDSRTFMNGFVHWIAIRREYNGYGDYDFNFLLVFNLDDETFSNMEMPKSCAHIDEPRFTVGNLGGWLSLMEYNINDLISLCTIWVMKEYGAAESWTRLYCVKLENSLDRVIGMLKMDELLMTTYSWLRSEDKGITELVIYNPETEKINNLGVSSIEDSQFVATHVDSLVLIAGANPLSIGRSTECGSSSTKSKVTIIIKEDKTQDNYNKNEEDQSYWKTDFYPISWRSILHYFRGMLRV